MKCLFDLSFIRYNLYAGVSKYAYRFLDYIVQSRKTDEFVLLLNSISEKQILDWYPQFKYVTIDSGIFKKIPVFRTLVLTYKFKKIADKTDCDVVFCPWGNEITCLKINKKKISVIHDLQLRIDLSGINLWIHKLIDNAVVKYSDKIVTISEFSKKQILSFYPKLNNDFVVSLGNSVSTNDYEGTRLLEDKYILYVGRICKMKNIITLVKAFTNIHKQLNSYKLVIIGKRNEYWYNEILPIIESAHIKDKVYVKEDCSDQELTMWYRYASLFVFPSLREGFGSPPLEAAIEMCPVLSTTCDSLKEVLMDQVFTYSHPCDAKELGEIIISILEKNTPSKEHLEKIKDIYIQNYSIQKIGNNICDFIYNITKK